jgi:predicted alpha/beta superfamily hydrolase
MKTFHLPVFFLLLLSIPMTAQVTYTVTVPNGTNSCFIAGEMTGWNQMQMNLLITNVYTLTIPYATTTQQYKYCSGPAWNYSETTANGGSISNRNYSANDVVAQWAITWDFTNNFPPSVTSGSIVRHWFKSMLVDSRYIDVWLPEGYSGTSKYPVLYMHDGQMLFDATTTWNQQAWDVDGTLGSLMSGGLIDRTIVVAIQNNGNKRQAEYFPEKVINTIPEPQKSQLESLFYGTTRGDAYLKFIVTELKPFIDNTYSTYPDRQHTFMGGSSMGGLISLYAFCEYPTVFSGAICMSTHWIGTFNDNSQIPSAMIDYLSKNLPVPTDRKIYFDRGTVGFDASYGPYQTRADSTLTAKGYNSSDFESRIFEGDDHNENAWKARFNIPATFILSNRTDAVSNPSAGTVLQVSPNPASSEISVEPFDRLEGKLVTLYDCSGKTVLSKPLIHKNIDLSTIIPGTYFMSIDGASIKIIKN